MTRLRPAERLVWAVETLAVEPNDRLLEVGCGHGVAVSLVCAKLAGGDGGIVAIDRSAKMIELARARNADHVAAGLAAFRTATLDGADFGDVRFDKVFAVHVPVFLRGDPGPELAVIGRHLAPGGRLFVVGQPLDGDAAAMVERLTTALGRRGYTVVAVHLADLAGGPIGCVVALPEADGSS